MDNLRQVSNAKRFSLKELDTATNHFREVLGVGSFGSVYRGRLADGSHVAIKMRSDASQLGADSFANEVPSILIRKDTPRLLTMRSVFEFTASF